MNLNQIRIIEACHKFLIGITEFEEELQNDVIVYQYKGDHVSFDTYQECENLSFVDYNLQYGNLDESRTYLDNREDLVKSFPSEEHLRTLQRISDPNQARIQIFKLISQVNIDFLSEKFPNVKKDNFGYGFYNYTTKEEYPIYRFFDNDLFELVAIS